MITSQRYEEILNILKRKSTITVDELCTVLQASPSTVRRDLTALHKQKKLNKVFGGATSIEKPQIITYESDMVEKLKENIEQKKVIAKYCANLIKDYDCVYIDAGSTTSLMSEFIVAKDCLFVTNGIGIAKSLILKNLKTILLGGNVRLKTDSIVGEECINMLGKFHFSKGFFGTNGITQNQGFTTHDLEEANVKSFAISHCKSAYILSDNSKFGKIYSVSFANIDDAQIITYECNHKFKDKYISVIDTNNLMKGSD